MYSTQDSRAVRPQVFGIATYREYDVKNARFQRCKARVESAAEQAELPKRTHGYVKPTVLTSRHLCKVPRRERK